jgi:hypothetical protein
MRIDDSQWRRKAAATNSDAGLKPGGYKVKSTGLKTGHYFAASSSSDAAPLQSRSRCVGTG